jgi:restriction system protein
MAKNSLGSSLTIFEVSDLVISELQESLARDAPTTPILEADAGELQEIKEDFEAKSHEFMKDAISRLDWEEMQYLVAGLLRAMGYRTRVSRRGPDRGRDVIASPDGLGLEEPRIVVEVKHRQGVASTQMLRSFLGGLRGTDRGIFVSTGGFSREAQYEAERSNVPCSLIDLDHFVELITDYYDKFDPESRSLLPLRKVYWPV